MAISMLKRKATYLDVLFIWNAISLVCSGAAFFWIHSRVPTVPDAIKFGIKDLSRDQIINRFIETNVVVDHAYNLMCFFLHWWIATGATNLAFLIYGFWRKKEAAS